MPGMNPRKMQQMMRKMGIQQTEIDAVEVIIKCSDKEIVISDPQVSKVNVMGQQTYQIVGKEQIRSLETSPEIDEEDVKTVMEQAGVDEKTAKKAIDDAEGDLAQAILNLNSEENDSESDE